MLEELQQRLRDLNEINDAQRQSSWHGSVGSVPSSNGRLSFQQSSPPQRMSQTSPAYQRHQQSSPPVPVQQQQQQAPGYGDQGTAQRISPPAQFQHQPDTRAHQQYPVHHGQSYGQPQQPHFHPSQHQPYNFSEPVQHNAALAARPSQQFAAWTGYGGPPMAHAMDDENTVPPKSNPWELTPFQMDAFGAPVPQSPRQQMLRQGPSPRASIGSAAQLAPQDRPPFPYRLEIPRTTILPPMTGGMPAPATSTISYQPQGRRISMHDAALDVLQTTYPPAQPQPRAYIPPQQPFPPPAIYSGKGKERAHENSYWARAQSPILGGFRFRPGIGYVCVACGSVCHFPDQHRTLAGGGGCVDLGLHAAPLSTVSTGVDIAGLMGEREDLWQAGHPPPMGMVRDSAAAAAGMQQADLQQVQHVQQPDQTGWVDESKRVSEGAGLPF
ncbi:hypothetical protein LTR37_000686 [Vermiconidia calcicola]|uniref:Uncharacterized protein n=1 Tax=Vermiconidia calcicola TaxID=1690605 RepID=A0ACC3NZA3_9PEZI|nr:hypothetical protein LTR37_000686 [Vermiconidia calcicola]